MAASARANSKPANTSATATPDPMSAPELVDDGLVPPSMAANLALEDTLVFESHVRESTPKTASEEEIAITVEGPDSLSSSALSGASTIVPDEPDGLHSHAASCSCSSAASDAEDAPNSAVPRPTRVRFRSRVRITSGLHAHHKRPLFNSGGGSVSSLASSLSASSSVSAPLRSPPTEATSTPGWGTLGTRVGLFAHAKMAPGRRKRQQGERRALLADGGPARYDGEEEVEHYYDDEALLSRQIDIVFGSLPWRLLNGKWWWWHLQPIICCGCLDEEDD
ncbi:hypothetical protein MIND_00432700 [Mycena indigotica]|uniref:Uncharacterized protein n=1 Tax=Mycena indigotica TaxID=2126181 RepID=A0A8H6SYU5_9AGAR|nr:uncharacterized protein MIND_00432700 [Mycena indigotica]KAF7306415.1 hypothetical protein MIND_00432700 [Mycena indigotica]